MEVAEDKIDLAIGLLSELADLPSPSYLCTCAACQALKRMHRSQTIKIASNLVRDLERLAARASLKRADK